MMNPLRQAAEPNLSSWLDRHGDYLYRYAIFRLRDPMIAEDLLQETLLAGIKGYQSFRGASSERTWLVGILRHKILDHFRELSRFPMDQTEEAIDDISFEADGSWRSACAPLIWHAEPHELVERKEFWDTLSQGLFALPTRTATAFILREIDRLSTDEICEALNVSRENLWVMLHRARLSLRGFLQTNWFATPRLSFQAASPESSQTNNHMPLPTSVSFASGPRLIV